MRRGTLTIPKMIYHIMNGYIAQSWRTNGSDGRWLDPELLGDGNDQRVLSSGRDVRAEEDSYRITSINTSWMIPVATSTSRTSQPTSMTW